MALLPDVFVPDDIEDDKPHDAGWYEAEITKSQLKETQGKDGKYISMGFKLLEDEVQGQMVWTNLNIINKNPTAVKIAQKDLQAICNAVGFEGDLEDTADLHNIPMMIKLSVKEATDQWPAKNEIKGFKAID